MSFALDTAERITRRLDEMIAAICPTAGRRPMYGGIVFEKDPGVPGTMVCGHFIYKAHVGLEFSKGNQLRDPQSLLAGSGKYRRHVKLRSIDDIDDKCVRDFLRQAFAMEP
ncbi:MAG: DUF1801 domain-containing protein [Pseudomonadota bacterium]